MIVKVTLIDSVLTERGEDKIKGLFNEESPDVDWDSMGIIPNDSPQKGNNVTLDDEDYKPVEMEASIIADEVSYWYKTPQKETTTLNLKTGVILTAKENKKYFDDKLNIP